MALREHIDSSLNWLVRQYKQWYVAAGAAVLLSAVVLLINLFPFMEETELKTLDYRFTHLSREMAPDSNIVLVAIDKNSLEYFKEFGISWPWPRDFYAHALNYLTAEQAKAVIFDMLFYEPDLRREETSPEMTDGRFADAIARHGYVVLGAELQTDSGEGLTVPARFGYQAYDHSRNSKTYGGITLPIDTLLGATASLGITNVSTDPDGIIRRVKPFYRYQSRDYANIALSGMLTGEGSTVGELSSRGFHIPAGRVPLQKDGSYLIHWYGEGGGSGKFPYVTFSSVIQSASASLSGGSASLPPDTFKDKYVIIGATAPGLLDLKPTPYSRYGTFPGMEIWATVLSNFLQEDFIRNVPGWANYLNTVLVSFLVILLFTRFSLGYSSLMMLGILGYIAGIAGLFWYLNHMWIAVTLPATGFVISYGFIAAVSFAVEGRSKLEIRKVFSRYVHPDVIQNLLEEPERVKMGGDEITATVMFSDIYDFTTFSEGKSASELVTYLNTYFTILTGFVLDHDGLLDKYTGDGIMALFGAPISRADHAKKACQAALAHREYSEGLLEGNGDLSPSDHFHLNTRIGLNSGPIVAGNIGSERRTDYTAIGDDVNLAARLEGVNKIFRTKIILSESTHEFVEDDFVCRELDMLRVKGKREPVKIYELVGTPGQLSPAIKARIGQYQEGLEEYRQGNWKDAIRIFGELSGGPEPDPASRTMYERCQILREKALDSWDGIFTLESK